MINLIWAMTEERLIGNGDKIPWHIKEDLLYYKNKTAGKTVLMGEATYYSLKSYYKNKPLPYEKIYVCSLTENLVLNDAKIIDNLLNFVKNNEEEIWVVGGATIYELMLPYADKLYISQIKGNYHGDKYFPEFDISKYDLVWENETQLVRYMVYEKRK